MVARSLASDMITADALIGRAERKGWDYDTVNWDELQGKDLMFMDRLNRLERQTGETQTRMEEEGEIDWQIEKYESEYQEFVKAEARKVADKGKTKIPKDMAMQKDFSGGGRMEFTVVKEKKGLVKPRYQESKVKPREKPKEQAILTSKEDLAKSSLPKGQDTLIVAVVTTDEAKSRWEGFDNRELAERYKELAENERKAPSEERKRQIRSWENEILREFHRRLPEDEADEIVMSLVKGEKVKLPKERQSKTKAKKGTKWQDAESVSYTNIGVGSRVTDKSGAVYEIVGVEVPDTVPAHRIYTLEYEMGSMGKRPTSKYGKVAQKDIILDQKLGQMERHYRKVPATSFERHEARGRAKSRRRRKTWDNIKEGEHYTINAKAGKKRYGRIIGKKALVVEKRDPGYSYPITVKVDGERYHLSPKALSEK